MRILRNLHLKCFRYATLPVCDHLISGFSFYFRTAIKIFVESKAPSGGWNVDLNLFYLCYILLLSLSLMLRFLAPSHWVFFRAIANGCSVEFRSGPVGERAGLGADRPGEIGAEDDEFDAYRKRMMLAYRFRPNPLVGGLRTSYTRQCTSEKCSVTSAVFQTV